MTTKWGSTCKLYFRKRSRNNQDKYISKQQQQRQGKRVIQINRRWSGQEANDQKQGNSPGSKHGKQGKQEAKHSITSEDRECMCTTFQVLLM